MVIFSFTILVSGSVRAKRRSQSVSRSHAKTLATSVSGFMGAFSLSMVVDDWDRSTIIASSRVPAVP